VPLSPEALHRCEGLYWLRGTDSYRRLAARNGTMESVWGQSGAPLRAVGDGVFAGRTTDFRVEVGPDKPRRLIETVRGSGAKPTVFECVDLFSPNPSEAAEYGGMYRSDEIEPAYRIEATDGKLLLLRMKSPAATLEPLERDVFRCSVGTLRFFRDDKGRLAGFTISNGRVRRLRFRRDETRATDASGRRITS
jgi:hypothetical protein